MVALILGQQEAGSAHKGSVVTFLPEGKQLFLPAVSHPRSSRILLRQMCGIGVVQIGASRLFLFCMDTRSAHLRESWRPSWPSTPTPVEAQFIFLVLLMFKDRAWAVIQRSPTTPVESRSSSMWPALTQVQETIGG